MFTRPTSLKYPEFTFKYTEAIAEVYLAKKSPPPLTPPLFRKHSEINFFETFPYGEGLCAQYGNFTQMALQSEGTIMSVGKVLFKSKLRADNTSSLQIILTVKRQVF